MGAVVEMPVVRAHRIHPETANPAVRDVVQLSRAAINSWTGLSDPTYNFQAPTREMLDDPMWEAIWDEVKGWRIGWPTDEPDAGALTPATGSHVTAIYLAIRNRERETEGML